MASVVVSDHVIAGILHVQVLRDDSVTDPQAAFSATINGPGFTETLPIANGSSKQFTLSNVGIRGLPANPTILAEVDDFGLVPPGSPAQATALSFTIVFKLIEIFRITIGSIPVHASLK